MTFQAAGRDSWQGWEPNSSKGCGRPHFHQMLAVVPGLGLSHCQLPFQLNKDNAEERGSCDLILLVMTAELLACSRNEG